MSEKISNKNLKIPKQARIKVFWDDKPENYTKEGKNRVKTHFAKKYGVLKNNVNVIFRAVNVSESGEKIEIDGAGIDNIMDVNYQRELFKEWIDRESKNVEFKRIAKLDDKVNSELDVDLDQYGHRTWVLKWVTIDNFLCFGDGNHVKFDKLKGLTIVNSNPKNQGGKSTFSVDTIKFLLFGKTTKTDTNSEIFNSFTDKNELMVKGMVKLDGEDVVIERYMTRKAKRNGGWNITNKVSYYKVMPDGEEVILEDEHAIATNKKISKIIGTESDFDTTILATANNLEDLISSSPTQSGKLITKFIGLEVIEKKETIARKMYNEFSKKMKSNHHDVSELKNNIEDIGEEIKTLKEANKNKNSELDVVKKDIIKLNNERDELLTSKKNIDVTISELNPSKIEEDIEKITKKGVGYKKQLKEINDDLVELKKYDYDEDKYFELSKLNNKLDVKIEDNQNNIDKNKTLLDNLKNGEICITCKRPLKDVDHSSEIKEVNNRINELKEEYSKLESSKKDTDSKLKLMVKDKTKVDERNNLEINKDKIEVDIDILREDIKAKKNDLKKYKDNKESIIYNTNVDAKLETLKTELNVLDVKKDGLVRLIQTIDSDIIKNGETIKNKETLISDILKEKEVEKIFKIYIEMVGKKGISKLVLRSVIPIINSELHRLMDEVVDFNIELNINEKNNIEFLLIKNGIEKQLKSGSGLEKTTSSLALRCVLGKMSNLPKPNFITFDEVFGKVAEENIEKMEPMFNKIKSMFGTVFIITMRELVKDWGDNIITINKEDDISRISVK